jgi:hypothetical protein
MRTKTLLIASAVALTAAINSSQAQSTVYSANVVGYVNLSVAGAGAYQLYSVALDLDGTGTNNTISTVIGNNVDPGTIVYAWNQANSDFDALALTISGRGASATTNWVLEGPGGGTDPTYPLNVGEGFFITDPNGTVTDTNFTETGNVLSGTVSNHYVPQTAGTYGLVASAIPYGGDLRTNLNYNATPGDIVYQWSGTTFNAYDYTISGRGASTATNWVLEGPGGGTENPQIPVGAGFFLVPNSSGESWVETFTNN